MKKRITLGSLLMLTLVFSCRQESINELSDKNPTEKKVSQKLAPISNGGGLALFQGEMACGSSNGSSLVLDPTISLVTAYNVSFWSPSGTCPNNGRTCIDLAHFVGILLPKGYSTGTRPFKVYYGNEQDYNTNYRDIVETFTIGETNNDGTAFGGYPYITDENTNKVLQAFTKEVNRIKSKRYHIKSYEIKTDALLCDPPYKYISVKVRYIDPLYDPETGIPAQL